MSFLLEARREAVKAATDVYKENTRISGLLDDKAQKAGGLAGVFLVAGFGFIKGGDVKAFTFTYGGDSGYLLVGSIVLFILCLGVCLAVMWVRASPSPVGIPALERMLQDFSVVDASELTDDVQQRYYSDQLAIWKTITELQQSSNLRKGRLLHVAQLLLGSGMICVAVLLIGIVVETSRGG